LCYMLCPSHPPWLDHSNYTWRRVQVMKFHIFSLLSLFWKNENRLMRSSHCLRVLLINF
jgi:hypothetical protein